MMINMVAPICSTSYQIPYNTASYCKDINFDCSFMLCWAVNVCIIPFLAIELFQ